MRKHGHGNPLVMVHGGFGDWRHWRANIEALAQSHTVLAIDLPGFGESTATPLPTMESLVDLSVEAVNAVVGQQQVISLAGFSFGGLAASLMAVKRGAVDALVLAGPVGHGGTRRPIGEQQKWKGIDPGSEPGRFAAIMRNNLRMHMLHREDSVTDETVQMQIDGCLRTRFYSKKFSRSTGLWDALGALTIPKLIVWGEHDVTATPQVQAREMLARIDALECRIFSDAGHWVQHESAGHFNALLLTWLARAR